MNCKIKSHNNLELHKIMSHPSNKDAKPNFDKNKLNFNDVKNALKTESDEIFDDNEIEIENKKKIKENYKKFIVDNGFFLPAKISNESNEIKRFVKNNDFKNKKVSNLKDTEYLYEIGFLPNATAISRT